MAGSASWFEDDGSGQLSAYGLHEARLMDESEMARRPKPCTTCKGKEKKKTWAEEHPQEMKDSLAEQKKMLEAKKADLLRNDDATKAGLQKIYGSSSEETRLTTLDRVNKELALNDEMSKNPSAYFQDAVADKKDVYAYVYPNDTTHQIYLGDAFKTAPLTGTDSQAGTLAHEMSHFTDIGGTKDNAYGTTNALGLATSNPSAALNNADSFEYYVEGVK